MNYLTPLRNFRMLFIFVLIFSTYSCTKDSDLFLEAINEEIIENIEEEEENEEQGGNQNSNVEPGDTTIPDITAPFDINAGNDIPLTPDSPNRIIYIATDGSSANDGLSSSNPKDIDSAFDKNFVQAGDLFYIKAGRYNYGSLNGNGHYDMSNLPCSASEPCYWIGYKDTPGDISASQYATVSWDDYKSGSRNADNTHDLDASKMPTFSGNNSSGKYIDNGNLFYTDGGEQGFVFRNMQIQYFRRGFYFNRLSNSTFENVTQANHGWFTEVKGQGGSNSDLQGTGWFLHSNSTGSWGENNKIINCASYNMTFRAFAIGNSRTTLVAYCEATSDIDNGNPQDYYFHTIGKNNVFTNVKANRLISSNHSGHGICFNQKSENNVMQHSRIYGTSVHFDGAIHCYANEIELIGDNSYGLYKGGDFGFIDGAEYNLVENSTVKFGDTGFIFADSGKNPYEEHAGQNNVIRNVMVEDKLSSMIDLFWWDEVEQLSSNNSFQNCSFKNAPNLFKIARPNSSFSLIDTEVNNVTSLIELDNRKGNFALNNNTNFLNSNFWQSELPSKDQYVVENVTNNPPN